MERAEGLDAAGAVRSLRGARFGFLGHTYPGMLTCTRLHPGAGAGGSHVVLDDALVARVETAEPGDERKGVEIREMFELAQPGTDPTSTTSLLKADWSARVAVGLTGSLRTRPDGSPTTPAASTTPPPSAWALA
jgi:L-arabinose isomerase